MTNEHAVRHNLAMKQEPFSSVLACKWPRENINRSERPILSPIKQMQPEN